MHHDYIRGINIPTNAVLFTKAESTNTQISNLNKPTINTLEFPSIFFKIAQRALVSFIPSEAMHKNTTVNIPEFPNPYVVYEKFQHSVIR